MQRAPRRVKPRETKILPMFDPKRYDVRLWTGSVSELITHLEKQFARRKVKSERWLVSYRARGTILTYSKKLITTSNDPTGVFTKDYVLWNAICYELGFGPETQHWFNP